MFRSPDVRDIGIHLDVPRGLVVERADGAAREAGLSSGDRIVAAEGTSVLAFGDLLHVYDGVAEYLDLTHVPRAVGAEERALVVLDGGAVDLDADEQAAAAAEPALEGERYESTGSWLESAGPLRGPDLRQASRHRSCHSAWRGP